MLEAVEDALAGYRLTRLITADSFPPIVKVRQALGRRWGEDDWRTELLGCAWCMGVWVAFAVQVVRRSRWWRTVAPALASAAVSGLIAENLG